MNKSKQYSDPLPFLNWILQAVFLILVLSLSGCARPSSIYQPTYPNTPPLPQSAKVPPMPPDCNPTCWQSYQSWQKQAQQTLTELD